MANNPCIVAAMRDEMAGVIDVPERPELVVALGAALIGIEDVVGSEKERCGEVSGVDEELTVRIR